VRLGAHGSITESSWGYAELLCTPGGALAGYYFVATDLTGKAVTVVDLANQTCGPIVAPKHTSYGLAAIKSKSGGSKNGENQTHWIEALDTPDAGATEGATGNGALMILKSLVPLTPGIDLEPNHDGKLKLPEGATLIDGITLAPSGGTLPTYVPRPDQPESGAVAATRLVDKMDPLKADAWYTGDLKGGDDSTDYDPTKASANMPKGAVLTPG